jgi:hypothetical protein
LIEYWWESSGASGKKSERIESNNGKLISTYFNDPGTEVIETETEAGKIVWENDSVYVEQFAFADRIRVLISWK